MKDFVKQFTWVVLLGLAGQAAWAATSSPESLDGAPHRGLALIGVGQRLEAADQRLAALEGVLHIAAAAQDASSAPPRPSESGLPAKARDGAETASEPEVPLRERTATMGVNLEMPENLFEIKMAVEQSFGVELAIEPLPEQCSGADEAMGMLDPFSISGGERFSEVIARLESASDGRWIFEEIHGVPLLRPNSAMEEHGTLLDTIISVDVEASSMWEALCALALAINRANDVQSSGLRPLIIRFLAPTVMKLPPSIFLEHRTIRFALRHAPAREGLCAILSQVGANIRYSYTCVAEGRTPFYDYIDISAFDAVDKVVDGGKMGAEEYGRLLKTVDWMSDERILAVQAPALDATAGPAKP